MWMTFCPKCGKSMQKPAARKQTCGACPFKEQCCPGSSEKGREVMRTVESAAVVAYREKMETEAAKALYRKRGEVAEFLLRSASGAVLEFSYRNASRLKLQLLADGLGWVP